jgi:CBS domain-containing protein
MHFITLKDLSSTDVISIDIESTLAQAIEKMSVHDRYCIIVLNGKSYKAITVNDILRFSTSHEEYDDSVTLDTLDLREVPYFSKDDSILSNYFRIGLRAGNNSILG